MSKTLSNTVKVGVLSAGFLLIGSAAHAADNFDSSHNVGIGNGNQIKALVQAPINVCGNAVGVIGTASAWCKGGAHASLPAGALDTTMTSTGNVGLLAGNQIDLIAQVPVNVCGNAISVLGTASAGCEGGSSATVEPSGHMPPWHDGGPTPSPYGHGHGQGHGQGHGHMPHGKAQHGKNEFAPPMPTRPTCDVTLTSTDNVGALNGNQVVAPIQVPIDISGNAVSVIGQSTASSTGGASAVMC